MKRFAAMMLALMMMLSMAAAHADTLPEDDPTKTITFSIWNLADDFKHFTSFQDSPAVKFLDRKFNVVIEYQHPPMGAEAGNFTNMVGTDDLTDVMNLTYSSDSPSALYEDGVIIDIAPYLEKYMPNYYALLQGNEELRKLAYDDDGHLFSLYEIEDTERNQWGGLVYRRDILDTMTGGNVAFPSGNDTPTTIEDWDYMLPLMKQYFDAAGMGDAAACLIIPASGYVLTGELVAGFGTSGYFNLSADGKTVEYGPITESFRNYVAKMREWYEKGYIYQDFASRTNDLFYLPNTALTYGGMAGAWFGLLEQNGTAMSMPEYGLNMLVLPAPAPLDTEHGVTGDEASIYIFNGVASNPHAISSHCDLAKLPRILTVMDYMYSEEGSLLHNHGLNAEQAKDDELYQSLGLTDGYYWFDENGNYYQNEIINNEEQYNIKSYSLTGGRLPGLQDMDRVVANKERTENDDYKDLAGKVWTQYGRSRCMPGGATLNADENVAYKMYITSVTDYVNSTIPQFIMGTMDLNEDTWNEYVNTVINLGMGEILVSEQSAYDRYLAR